MFQISDRKLSRNPDRVQRSVFEFPGMFYNAIELGDFIAMAPHQTSQS